MANVPITTLFHLKDRFLRSTHLERDFNDPHSLEGYVITDHSKAHLAQLIQGLRPTSGRRAWRITGDYGSGKSSFALLTANLFGGRIDKLGKSLANDIGIKGLSNENHQLLPILITGAREPLSKAIMRSLYSHLLQVCGRGRKPEVLAKLNTLILSQDEVPDEAVLRLVCQTCSFVVSSGKAKGILLILDELGKFLEFAAFHPERQDIFLLQGLAETASRSGRTPLFVIGLLHQGFTEYADTLSQSAQREWEKVAGRFDELIFSQPLEEIVGLIGNALNVATRHVPKNILRESELAMAEAANIGWFGGAAVERSLRGKAAGTYPLHPTSIPILVQLFTRFGQNQRSLFSFLLSSEPFGLQDFSRTHLSNGRFYRLSDLYDYARSTFGHRLSVQSYRSHWNHIESLVESYAKEDHLELQILKTVGLLNLIDHDGYLATDEAVILALASTGDEGSANTVRRALKRLHGSNILYRRGSFGGYRLWPHSSANLERAYEKATAAVGSSASMRVASQIQSHLTTRPLVARRHYIETGNLRHFEVHYSPVDRLAECLTVDYRESDGRVIVALCESNEDRQNALEFAQSKKLRELPNVIVAVPSPLSALAKLVQELQRWEWVSANTPELNEDTYASSEVSRQLMNARDVLEKQINLYVGIQTVNTRSTLQWFRQSKRLSISTNRELLAFLSGICDEVFCDAPKVHNELINRRSPSAAANGARTRLLQGIFSAATQPFVGLNPTKKPPEMAIYLSLLQRGGIHGPTLDGRFELSEPTAELDICNLRPALSRIRKILEERDEIRIRVSDLVDELRKPPYGVRDGIAPILIAIFAAVHEEYIAFYDAGKFMREMSGLDVLRFTKIPENFEIQYCRVAGIRSRLFDRLSSIFAEDSLNLLSPEHRRVDLLGLVRPLCVFAAKLPKYTHSTKRLPATVLAVRAVLLNASEPASLLFRELPVACGFKGIAINSSRATVETFVETLKDVLIELRGAYTSLQDRIVSLLFDNFQIDSGDSEARELLARRADNILGAISDSRLKAFCLRLCDGSLSRTGWIESIGSFVCSVPPSKWSDLDEERFSQELEVLAGKFRRVEPMAYATGKNQNGYQDIRLTITTPDGEEVDNVIHVTRKQEAKVAQIEQQLKTLIDRDGRIAVAGITRALWRNLKAD